jgi:hypothetical protein
LFILQLRGSFWLPFAETQKVEKDMNRKNLIIIIVALLLLAIFSAVSVQAGYQTTHYLDWRQIVPFGTGNPNMFGDFSYDVNSGQGELCYEMRVFIYPSSSPAWPPAGATIHEAPAGSNGPVVVDLQPAFDGANASGCVDANRSLAQDIKRNPSAYYLLVTDQTHPDGAARVQLTR